MKKPCFIAKENMLSVSGVSKQLLCWFPYCLKVIIIIVQIIYFLVLWDHRLILSQFENRVPLKPVLGGVGSVAPLNYCS